MSKKLWGEYLDFCNNKNLTIDSNYAKEQFRMQILMNKKGMSKDESFKFKARIVNIQKDIKSQNDEKKQVSNEVDKVYKRNNKGAHSYREQNKKNLKRLINLAKEHNINPNASSVNYSDEDHAKVCKILEQGYIEKGKNSEQIKKLMQNYNNAKKSCDELYINNDENKNLRNRAVNLLAGTKNGQKYLLGKKFDEGNVIRCMKMMKESDKMLAKNKRADNQGNKKAYSDDPSRVRRAIKFFSLYTELDSLRAVRAKHMHRLAENLVEEGMSQSVQQNTLTAVRGLSIDFNFKYKDEIPNSNIKLGAQERVYGKIDNAATNQEFEKGRAFAKDRNPAVYWAMTMAGIGLRIEELTSEVTLDSMNEALKKGKFHVESGKGDRERDIELFDTRTRGYVQELRDYMVEKELDGNPFLDSDEINFKEKNHKEMIKHLEDWTRKYRKYWEDEGRLNREDIRMAQVGQKRDDMVVERCHLTMHSYRAMFATNCYIHRREQLLNYYDKFGKDALVLKMKQFYGKQTQIEFEKYKRNHENWIKRGRAGKEPKKPNGYYIKDFSDKQLVKYIEDAAMLYASYNLGHGRKEVTKIYIARVLKDKKVYTDIATYKNYNCV